MRTIGWVYLVVCMSVLVSLRAGSAGLPPEVEAEKFRTPAFFTANEGQFDSAVLFRGKLGGLSIFFTREGPVYSFGPGHETVLRYKFLDADPCVSVGGENPLPHKSNYYVGDRSRWREGVQHFGAIRYENLYPGIDAVYSWHEGGLKYDFVVWPGGDPERILLDCLGATSLTVGPSGALTVSTPSGSLRDQAPVVYQEYGGEKVMIPTSHRVLDGSVVGFRVHTVWDRERTLTIDPYVIYSTFLGGNGEDYAWDAAADRSDPNGANSTVGYLYVTGYTDSSDFPTPGEVETGRGSGTDVFVAKFDATGDYKYGTYIGGSAGEEGRAIAVSYESGTGTHGKPTVVGYTSSDDFPTFHIDSGFPELSDINDGTGGVKDGFVLTLDSDGKLLWSTYLGGRFGDEAYGVAVQQGGADIGSVYVCGVTKSDDFPTQDAYQAEHADGGGVFDCFITKFSALIPWIDTAPAAGCKRKVEYSSFIGSASGSVADPNIADSGIDQIYHGVAVDNEGKAYLALGVGAPMDVDEDAADVVYDDPPDSSAGINEGFVLCLEAHDPPNALTRRYATYVGGHAKGGIEYPLDVVLGADNSLYVGGYSPADDYPATPGAYGTPNPGVSGDFAITVTKIAPDGKTFLFSTIYGTGYANGITLDGDGDVWIAGDNYISQLKADGSDRLYHSHVPKVDTVSVIRAVPRDVDSTEIVEIAIVGWTEDTDFPTLHAAFPTHGDGGVHEDAYVMLWSTDPDPAKFRRGDSNQDGAMDLADALATLGFVFNGTNPEVANCADAADTNDDGVIDLSDAIYLLDFVFNGTVPQPDPPFDECGPDPTLDGLDCPLGVACAP